MTLDGSLADRVRAALPRSCTLEVTYVATEPVELPSWMGSLLHGAIGGALRTLTCTRGCDERHASGAECPYVRLFEAGSSPAWLPPWLQAARPPMLSLVLRPPGEPRALERGDSLVFSIRLFGRAVQDVGFLVAALERAGEDGFGKHRGRMRLDLVDTAATPIYQRGAIRSAPRPDPAPRVTAPNGPLVVRTVTPLRLLRGHELVESPTPADLAQAAYRRAVALGAHHGTLEVEPELPPSLPLPAGAPASPGAWEYFRVQRYSNRQHRKHAMEGVQGSLQIAAGDPASDWLLVAPAVGLGKATAFGFGQVAVEAR